ncbi:MAG TPA: hypothetical protein PKM48_07645 [Parvularculaceae bacterium]|nr:hypothetical protein [Parvularculaceae bacterium]HNS87213.1 hypothetical protein [Parvularculaceae bacterium]
MKVLGIRFCNLSAEAQAVAEFLGSGLGLPERDLGMNGNGFVGAIFPAGESWIELWRAGDGMPAMTMLQIVVDDADAFAAHARANGLEQQGPTDAHGERIYSLTAPGGLQVSFQAKLA